MVVVRASELVASGYLVTAKHPWKTGRLRQVAEKLGISIPADAILLRIPPPWSKVRDYLKGASVYQLEAMLEFGKKASQTAGMPLEERLIEIRKSLKGRTYGRTPRPRAPALPNVERELAIKRRMPVAPAGGGEVVL